MRRTFLIALDAGGGSGRSLLVNTSTREVISATRPWSHLPAADLGGWGCDLDLDTIWAALGEASREVMQRAGASSDEVVGMAATSMRHSTIVLDRKGSALFATPNHDARAAELSAELAAERGAEFHRRCGHWPIPPFTGVRLKWLAQNMPQVFNRASTVLSLSEWITFRLCGEAASDPSHAGETMLFDVQRPQWAWDLIASLDLPREFFPRIMSSGKRLGKLTAPSAAHLGLRAGIPVAVGGADTQCGLLGAGVVAPGQLGIIAGTTTPLQLAVGSPVSDPQAHLWTGRHVLAGVFVLEGIAGSMGESLEWIAGILYPDARRQAAMLDAEAAQSSPGAAGLLSTFGTQVFDASNMGLPYGYLALSHMAAGTDPHRRKHVARAVLEGLAYAVRANAEQLTRVSGIARPEYFLAGGMSRSAVWRQILADVLGQPVMVSHLPEASALGAAVCAGVGAGVFRDLVEGSAALTGESHSIAPCPEAVEIHGDIYPEWLQFRTAHTEADAAAGSLLLKGIASCQPQTASRRRSAFRPHMLITAQMDETALNRLRRLGQVTYQNYRETYRVLTGEDLVEAMKGKHVLITEVDVVDVDVLAQLPDIRLVASCRGNAVNIDSEACAAFGVPLLNTPGRNADAVADLAVSFMLMLARRLAPASQFLHDPEAEAGDLARMGAAHSQFQGVELWRKTVGLIGMGAVGRGVTRRLVPFGVRVLVHDPFVSRHEATLAGAEWAPLDTLLRESDFVSLHATVTPETTGMLGAKEFRAMKAGAFLINTARAALTDEAALVETLRSGHLAGAALDVFSAEPPGPNDPLLLLPNVIATPHVGGNTRDVPAHQGEIIADEMERILAGERPRFLVTPAAFDDFSWTRPRSVPPPRTLAQLRTRGGPAISDLDARPPRESGSRETRPAPSRLPVPPEPVAVEKGTPTAMSHFTTFERILCEFLTASETDAAFLAFAASRVFVMHYALTDASLEFHMIFDNGTVKAGMGAPPGKSDLTLKMKAEVFDGMMTGKINAMSAAMSGKMKFSGDTGKAMQMQRVQKDIMRLYSRARQRIGDPGDLSTPGPAAAGRSVSTTPEVVVSPAPTPRPRLVESPPQPLAAGDERDELVATVRELYEKNLITATGGNLSVRVAGRESELWITPSAMFKGSLRADTMIRINLQGEAVEEEAATPSSERWVHTEILAARPDLQAVIHTHAPWATLLALSETPFLPVSTEAAFIGDIPRVPFIMPGTRELAEAVARALGEKGVAVLMQNHGLVVGGSSLRRAASTTEVVERYAELILQCLTLGKQPPVLPEEVVKSLREMGQMMA